MRWRVRPRGRKICATQKVKRPGFWFRTARLDAQSVLLFEVDQGDVRRYTRPRHTMDTILLTGATGFLGYHVAKKLNAAGVRPRVLELRDGRPEVLDQLDVERCAGYLDEPGAVRAA